MFQMNMGLTCNVIYNIFYFLHLIFSYEIFLWSTMLTYMEGKQVQILNIPGKYTGRIYYYLEAILQ